MVKSQIGWKNKTDYIDYYPEDPTDEEVSDSFTATWIGMDVRGVHIEDSDSEARAQIPAHTRGSDPSSYSSFRVESSSDGDVPSPAHTRVSPLSHAADVDLRQGVHVGDSDTDEEVAILPDASGRGRGGRESGRGRGWRRKSLQDVINEDSDLSWYSRKRLKAAQE